MLQEPSKKAVKHPPLIMPHACAPGDEQYNHVPELLFPCRPDNNAKMKDWLLKRYASLLLTLSPIEPYNAWKAHH